MPGCLRHRAGSSGARARGPLFYTVLCLGIIFGLAAGGWAVPAFSQPRAPLDIPVLITADEISHDESLGIVTARGNVEIAQGERILRADVLSFNRQSSVVTATGNVSVIEPTGDVIFADYVELSDQLKEGTIQNFRALLADHSRIAGVSARRSGGNNTIVRRAVYSPCELCRDDPTRAPLWQIKSARIHHDQAGQQITHNDARFELFGLPIAYTPYISHPDGTVQRKSGFLAPEFKSSSNLGQLISVPYYVAIDETSDATIEPIFMVKDAPILAGEYRQATAKGSFQGSASIASVERRNDGNRTTSGRDTRGHVKVNGRFDIDDDWRWGFQGERSTDDTYLQRYRLNQRYRFLSQETLVSNLYTEGFRDRNYAAANAFAFQGLRQRDDPGLSPYVLPMFDYNFVSNPGQYGGRYAFDANALSVYRNEGTRMQRTVLRGSWTLPWVSPSGEIYSLTASTRGDLYNTAQIGSPADPFRPTEDGINARAVPALNLTWRYPFVRRDGDIRTIVEPIAAVTAAPVLGNQGRFPNEDSRSVEFDGTNLFRMSRFDGWDRIEGGQHFDYGFNTSVYRANGGRASLFLGQSYRVQKESAFPAYSGLSDHQSSYVGRLFFSPHRWFSTRYSFQVDQDDLSAQRNRLSAAVGPSALQVSASYVFVDRRTQRGLSADIEQLGISTVARVSQNWRTQVRYSTSLSDADSGSLAWGGSLIYEDECILAGIDVTRRYVGNRDNPPDTAILFRVVFRNLGELETSLF